MLRNIFNIKALGIACMSVLLLTGCEDFLETEIKGNPIEENYYDTQYKLQTALNATYDILQSDAYTSADWRFGEALGDHVTGNDEGLTSHMGQLVHFRFDNSNSWILERWQINYKGIHRANQVIANIHRVQLPNDQKSTYDNIRYIYGQAKFLRALFYFNLVKTFGGVPIRPEIETVDNIVIPRSTLEETYAYIEKDLREAAVMLPVRFTGGNSGKAGSGAAVALLMRVLMYQAEPGVPSEKWNEMVKMGDFFVKGGEMTFAQMLKYDANTGGDWETYRKSLFFKPQELLSKEEMDAYEASESPVKALVNAYTFDYKDAYSNPISYDSQFYEVGEFCSGSIFEIVFQQSGDGTSGDTNEGNSVYRTLFPSAIADQGYMHSTDQWRDRIFEGDVRERFTIGHHETTPDLQNTEIGAGKVLPLKWYTPLKDMPTYNHDNAKNRRLLRYVDVVLMYAEALNETGDGASALDQLNSYKSVVNKINNGADLYVGGGYGYMRDQIWKEREIETCFEWERFWDIVRQGRAKQVLANYASLKSNKRGLYFREGINEIFPIPQTEIDVSNGVVEQNPGY